MYLLSECAMTAVPDIIPVSDLRQDAAGTLRRLSRSRRPLVVTQRGRATAVLVGIEAYQRQERERTILRLLAKGEREIRAGRGTDLEAVLAEADDLLGER
jgi:prevent-host-death family protein